MNPKLFPAVVTIATCGAFAFSATVEGSAGPNPALNAYSKLVKDIIGSSWYRHVEASDQKSRLAGKVVVDFRIASNGLVENLRVVSNTTSQQWADIAVQSIKEAKFPPIPKDALQGHQWLDVKNMSFGSQEGDSANPQARDAHNEGFDAHKKGDNDKAIALYDKAIRLDPKYAIAYSNRGNAYVDKGDTAKAIADYTEAIRLNPRDARAHFNRGDAYFGRADFAKAIADFDEAIRLNPKYEHAYCNRGQTYENEGNYDKAIADFTEAIRLDPKDGDPYAGRGNSYCHKGDYDKAAANFNEGIRVEPKNSRPYNSFAWILATAAQPSFRDGKKAVIYATKSCELSQWKNPHSIDTLAAAYAEAGDFEQAIKWEKSYLESSKLSEKAVADAKARLALYESHQPYHADK